MSQSWWGSSDEGHHHSEKPAWRIQNSSRRLVSSEQQEMQTIVGAGVPDCTTPSKNVSEANASLAEGTVEDACTYYKNAFLTATPQMH